MSDPENPADTNPKSPQDRKYKGVRGWLLLLAILLTVLNPIWLLRTFLFTDFTLYRFADIGLTCFALYAGLSLWTIRANAVRIARIYLVVQLAYSVGASLLALTLAASPEQRLQVLGVVGRQVLGSYIFFAIWYEYLKKSKRVVATYSGFGEKQSPAQAQTRTSPVMPVGQSQQPTRWTELIIRLLPFGKAEQPTTIRDAAADIHGPQRNVGNVRLRWLLVGWLATLSAVLAFAWFIWPTPYGYDRMSVGSSGSFPVRIHRLTGRSQVLYPSGWKEVPGGPSETWDARAIKATLEKVDIDALPDTGPGMLGEYWFERSWYTLQNTTDQDYELTDKSDCVSMVKLKGALAESGKCGDDPWPEKIFIPTHERVMIQLSYKVGRVQNRLDTPAFEKERAAQQGELVRRQQRYRDVQFDGHVLFDRTHHYRIDFPVGH